MKSLLSLAMMLLLVSAGPAFGQTGGVTGIVLDGEDNPVEEARVSLWLDGACQVYVLTGADGVFNFADVAVGTYDLKAGKRHLGNVILEAIEVIEGEVTDVGVIVLECTGPQGPGGPHKYMYQKQIGQQ